MASGGVAGQVPNQQIPAGAQESLSVAPLMNLTIVPPI
jgi:hypothetical protein